MKHSITMGEKVGYSLGDVAANLAFQMMMIYQLKFYTENTIHRIEVTHEAQHYDG